MAMDELLAAFAPPILLALSVTSLPGTGMNTAASAPAGGGMVTLSPWNLVEEPRLIAVLLVLGATAPDWTVESIDCVCGALALLSAAPPVTAAAAPPEEGVASGVSRGLNSLRTFKRPVGTCGGDVLSSAEMASLLP